MTKQELSELLEAFARLAEELVEERRTPPSRLLTTVAVAAWLNVSPDYVREHAAELGAVRLGGRPRGELRFEKRRVQRAIDARRLSQPAAKRHRRPGPPRKVAGVELLPLPTEVS